MQIDELITELTPKLAAVGIELDRKKAPEFIRKLASDKLISSPPRYKRSGPKGKGAASDWPEMAIQEIAAYFCVQNLRRSSGARIPKSIIREARDVARTLMKKPQDLCWIEVDEDDEIDLAWSNDLVLARPYLRHPGGPPLRGFDDEITLSIDKQVDFLLDHYAEFIIRVESLQKQNPDCSFEDYPGEAAELLEETYLVRKGHELAERPPLEFTVIPEAVTWIAVYEKIARKIPLSVPVDLEYRGIADVKLNKKSPSSYNDEYDESGLLPSISPNELTQAAENQNDAQTRHGPKISYKFEDPVVKKRAYDSKAHMKRVPQDRLYVHYDIRLQDREQK
jgi:hypothetical protein